MATDPQAGVISAASIQKAALAALVDASAAINTSLDLRDTLQAIAKSAASVLNADASSVLLLDRTRSKLVFLAAVGNRAPSLIGDEFDAKLGVAGRVVQTGAPMLVPDVRNSPHFFRGIDDKWSYTTRSLVAGPMQHNGEVIGVIEVLNKRGGEEFSPHDVEVLQVFANLAAVSVNKAQAHEAVKQENRALRIGAQRDDAIVGNSESLRRVLELIERVGPTNATVLILGETGTGKELVARALHTRSQRSRKPFIALHCAALPETLLESELFGHEEGAFTGATSQKLGRFELADGGTLFLDEIGEITPATQVRLLRVLQEREFVRVGGSKAVSCDVRILAATNRDLKKAISDGTFREDLYYRLNVFPIELPPLRSRRDDIPLLVDTFVHRCARDMSMAPPRIAQEALQCLVSYAWPGNLREMRNIIERAVLLCDAGVITPAHFPREISGESAPQAAHAAAGESSIAGFEKAMVEKALRENGWNQTRAAAALGISRDNLRYRLKKYGIHRSPG